MGGLSACVLLVCGAASARQAAAPAAAEGNPFRGRQLFAEKSCADCHSVWGHGGTLGPEMSVAVAGKPFYELVGDFWNHTPQMIQQGARLGRAWPTLDAAEMADMLSYLYYLRLFDEPGSAARGREAYTRLQCAACHLLAGRGGQGAAPLDRFGAYPAPTPLAQAMWNAGPRMQQTQMQRGSPIPLFGAHDMADLQAYIRAEGARPTRDVVLQPLPSPARGAAVYRNKGCGTCHDGGRRVGPDLARSALSKTVSEITGLLWNHSYAMGALMAAQGVAFPRFSHTEMSDLIAHLYFKGYVGDAGDAATGKALFAKKGCATCHGETASGPRDLSSSLQTPDRAGLASAMWNHAPQMHRTMTQGGVFWPKFEPGEMGHLAAYLRTLSPKAVHKGAPAGR
jgi:mono/diheme cytochrome c family protein